MFQCKKRFIVNLHTCSALLQIIPSLLFGFVIDCPDPPPPTFCPARIVGLVRYNATLAPASGSVTVTTQCADNARRTSSSLTVVCSSSGTWSGNPRCQCNSGYQTATVGGRQICQGIICIDN